MRAELLADPVDEQLDAAAAPAAIDIEVLAVDEQLADLAQ
jgi:hypothetical protein